MILCLTALTKFHKVRRASYHPFNFDMQLPEIAVICFCPIRVIVGTLLTSSYCVCVCVCVCGGGGGYGEKCHPSCMRG